MTVENAAVGPKVSLRPVLGLGRSTRVLVTSAAYDFLNRRRGARRALNALIPAGVRYLFYAAFAAFSIPFVVLVITAVGPIDKAVEWLTSTDALTLLVWLLFMAQGTDIRRTLHVVCSHQYQLLRQSTLTNREIFEGRVVLRQTIRTLLSGAFIAIIFTIKFDVTVAILAALLLMLTRTLLLSLDVVDEFDDRRTATTGLGFTAVLFSQFVSIATLSICLALVGYVDFESVSPGVGAGALVGSTALVLLLLILVGRRRFTVPIKAVKRRRLSLDRTQSNVLLEMSGVLRDPLQSLDFVESIPGLSWYILYLLFFTQFSTDNGSAFIVYTGLIVTHLAASAQLVESHFNPVHSRILRSRQYSSKVQYRIAAIRFRTLALLLIALTFPVVLVDVAVRRSLGVENLIGLLVIVVGSLTQAGAIVFGTIALVKPTATVREESFVDSSVMVLQGVTAGAIVLLAVAFERLLSLAGTVAGLSVSFGLVFVGLGVVFYGSSRLSQMLLPVAWRWRS